MARPYKRDDGRWEVRYRDLAGTTRYVYGRTSRECAAKLRSALNQRDAGRLPADSRATLAQILDQWLEDLVRPTRSDSTYRTYRAVLTPARTTLGATTLAQLRPAHLQRFYAQLRTDGRSPSTIRLTHTALGQALATAVSWDLIPTNPNTATTIAPPRPRKQMRPLTIQEALTLLETAAAHPYGLLWRTLISYGLRISEACGLLWEDVDTDRHTISINRQMLPTGSGTTTWEPIPTTKTPRSRRRIQIDPDLARRLAALRAEQLSGTQQARWPTVFRHHTGACTNRSLASDQLHRDCRAAGIDPATPHDLRHTCATILLSRNTHPKRVQDLLGHTSIQQTLDTYSHLIPGMHNDVPDIMEDLFGGPNAVESTVTPPPQLRQP